MRTMLPLRMAAIGANLCFIAYGLSGGVFPVLVLHLCLLPLNLLRLFQILRDRRRVQRNTRDDALKLLREIMHEVQVPAGTYLFRKGDPVDKVYVVEEGEVLIEERGLVRGAGTVIGEMAFFTDDRQRTASVLCTRDCRLLAADEVSFIDAFYRDPALGVFITKLIATRLFAALRRQAEAETEAEAEARHSRA